MMQSNDNGPEHITGYDTSLPPGRTLNDYRVMPAEPGSPPPGTTASRSAAGLLGVALIVGGAAVAAWYYTANDGAEDTVAVTAPATTDPSVPQTQGFAAPPAETAQDSAATAPLEPLTKAEEKDAMPEALHGNNHGSDAVGTARNQGSSSARTAPVKKAAPRKPAQVQTFTEPTPAAPPKDAAPPTPDVPPAPMPPSMPPQPDPQPEPQPAPE